MKRELYTDEFLAWMDGIKKASGDRLIYLREKYGLSQKALSEKSGVSVNTIQRIEKGTANTRLSTIFYIANDGFEISVAAFYNHPAFAVDPPKGHMLKNPPLPKNKAIKKGKKK